MRIEIGKATPSGWTLLETTNLYYAITYLQVRGEKVDFFWWLLCTITLLHIVKESLTLNTK